MNSLNARFYNLISTEKNTQFIYWCLCNVQNIKTDSGFYILLDN